MRRMHHHHRNKLYSSLLVFLFLNCCIGYVPEARRTAAADENEEIKTVNPDDWFQDCFRTFEENCCVAEGDPHIKHSNHYLIDSPSGLCADHLTCAFERCDQKGVWDVFFQLLFSDFNDKITYDDVKDDLGTLNLPAKITFPKTAADVVAAVEYAKENGMKISMKATGHSYTGSSTMKDSLQLNLRDLKTYTDDSIVECGTLSEIESDPNFRACALAKARGKEALIKVGGGETWSNVYLAMKDKVDANGTVLYEVVGGGAGSVGAAGGWLQGGGWSYGPERMYGLGVDQVLEFEMVLADGRHVLFGPTAWEDAEGFVYPKTTEVTGKCNSIVDEDEGQWSWGDCAEPVPPFADLWFAVRGGGGGTYGVVTALKYQLHPQKPMEAIVTNTTARDGLYTTPGSSEDIADQAAGMNVWFLLKLLYSPEDIGLTAEISNKCGAPALAFNPIWGAQFFVCYDNVFEDVVLPVWHAIVDSQSETDANIAIVAEPLKNIFISYKTESFLDIAMSNIDPTVTPEDKVPDNPLPSFVPDKGYGGWCSAQIPKDWLAKAEDDVFAMLFQTGGEHVTGGNVGIAHDQMSAITPAARSTGLSSTGLAGLDDELQHRILETVLKDANGETDFASVFPGMTEVNHVCIDSFGPLKSDMTKLCPAEYSLEEKEELCYSIQESIWGTETLEKLENIKTAVDPDGLFDCYPCVKSKTALTPAPTTAVTQSPTPSPTPKESSGGSFRKTNFVHFSVAFTVLIFMVQPV